MSERVHVSVFVEIDGQPVVNDVYDTNSRTQAAGDFEDWADAILAGNPIDDEGEG